MKRNLLILILLIAICGSFLFSASAALTPGTYTWSGGDLSNGSWTEWFTDGEGQASNQNILSASATDNSWSITANIAQNAVPGPYSNGYDFYTEYNVLFAFNGPGAWGDAFTLSGVTGYNYSKRDSYPDGDVAFHFSTNGLVDSVPVYIDVWFDSIVGSGDYNYDGAGQVHWGEYFEEITLQVVPIPGAAWLLASGLIGLVVIRRVKR